MPPPAPIRKTMSENTTGFKFSNDAASPNSDVNAENLNAAVEKATIFNIGQSAIKSDHISGSVAGAGLGGGDGSALFVKTDGETIAVDNDALKIPDGAVKENLIADGAVTMDKLAQAVKDALNSMVKNIYKVGDYFITHNAENPANRFGGEWELCKDVFLLGAGGDYEVLSTGGEKEHTLTTEEMPRHGHKINNLQLFWDHWNSGSQGEGARGNGGETWTEATGGDKPHNNMPPYKAVYIWVKISDSDPDESEDEA